MVYAVGVYDSLLLAKITKQHLKPMNVGASFGALKAPMLGIEKDTAELRKKLSVKPDEKTAWDNQTMSKPAMDSGDLIRLNSSIHGPFPCACPCDISNWEANEIPDSSNNELGPFWGPYQSSHFHYISEN